MLTQNMNLHWSRSRHFEFSLISNDFWTILIYANVFLFFVFWLRLKDNLLLIFNECFGLSPFSLIFWFVLFCGGFFCFVLFCFLNSDMFLWPTIQSNVLEYRLRLWEVLLLIFDVLLSRYTFLPSLYLSLSLYIYIYIERERERDTIIIVQNSSNNSCVVLI